MAPNGFKLQWRLHVEKNAAIHVTVDDIDSFVCVRRTGSSAKVRMAETKFEKGVAAVVGERGSFKDRGGASRQRLRLAGKRRIAAFAFKGPGKAGS